MSANLLELLTSLDVGNIKLGLQLLHIEGIFVRIFDWDFVSFLSKKKQKVPLTDQYTDSTAVGFYTKKPTTQEHFELVISQPKILVGIEHKAEKQEIFYSIYSYWNDGYCLKYQQEPFEPLPEPKPLGRPKKPFVIHKQQLTLDL